MAHLPLKALQAFRLAAEANSFKDAAEQLHVTQAAISQQIKSLEQHLGLKLFKRLTREVELTDAGRQLLPHVSRGFSSLETGMALLMDDPNPNRLTLSTLPSFASRWLVSKLGEFQQEAPDLSIQLTVGDQLERFEGEGLDLAIRFGQGDYPGLSTELMLKDYLIPACHPSLLKNTLPVRDQIGTLPWLQDDTPELKELWPEFAQTLAQDAPRLQVTDSGTLIEALLGGQGIAFVRFSLVYGLLERGILISPLPEHWKTIYDYYLVMPEHHKKRPKVRRFEAWLRRETNKIGESWNRFTSEANSIGTL
ncbi:LysR substrate-binding domain-containing protein [Pontibacterium granulatum]|uniref:LysR substrate-binding domain-containing protein n=1 Tax=Pontibacterium granulatum TaxID=2036029 RepID=UPI00249BD48B|nr:LysR substrate-binding domain-containing protein [Pontibacterium granulatum]MDI3324843.1 LysR substrate-binding domain-containing protein [Pontibacterium granulatum]